jgi:hypothetical protein
LITCLLGSNVASLSATRASLAYASDSR